MRLVNIPKKESLIKIQYTHHGVSVSGDFDIDDIYLILPGDLKLRHHERAWSEHFYHCSNQPSFVPP